MISDRILGHTMVELSLVVMIGATLILTLINVQVYSTSRLNSSRELLTGAGDAAAAIDRIELEIRGAISIDCAGADLLELTTRYVLDTDDEDERVRYTRVGSELKRAVAEGGASFGSAETVLTDVLSFDTRALKIKDTFLSEKYTDVDTVTKGDPDMVDTRLKVEYALPELGKVDDRLSTFYSETKERLEITPATATDGVLTVSPDIERRGSLIRVRFQPVDDDAEYRPIVFGDDDWQNNGIAVIFAADHSIKVRVAIEGNVEEVDSGVTWKAGSEYPITVEMLDHEALVFFDDPETRDLRKLGVVTVKGLDRGRAYLQAGTLGKLGAWDDLEVKYAIIDVHLSVDSGSGVIDLYGGATPRGAE